MGSEKIQASGSARLAQMLVSFLIGSGVTGVVLTLIRKEGFELVGVILWVAFVLVAVFVYMREQRQEEGRQTRLAEEAAQVQIDWAEERRADLTRQIEQLRTESEAIQAAHSADLAQLRSFYISMLTNVGEILGIRLALHERDTETDGTRRQGLRAAVLELLAQQTRQQAKVALQMSANQELSEGVLADIARIVGEWRRFGEEPVSLQLGPPDEDAQPRQEDG